MFQEMKWEDAKKVIDANPNNHLIFLNFTTTWCGDCKMMRPIVESIAEEYKNNKGITFINVDAEEAELFRDPDNKWKVLRVPTMILLQGNEIIERGYEYIPTQILSSWISKKLS
ncbi:thioredoxin family protein [Mycoplasmopsis verecunda]|uniref:Thioredoxin 1 n=1 Tax=Mycoplasmopsis verecunda TaxID=171291 RepID=A0A1T4KV01_9BACT|nr:thioredoxin family protein [Mycoplasmopsis verecunda]WPB54634.1 thioredoxin family protein [Mycoplasmopsis verecunda]SJZ46264.1 thioredoxin 1 [Mycoplasmopsis verecunda]